MLRLLKGQPGIVECVDVAVDQDNKRVLLALELCPGTLSTALQLYFDGPERKRQLCLQMVRGVHTLYRCRVAHRDLKPDNILITRNGDAVVSDFGIATDFHGEHHTTAGTVGWTGRKQAKMRSAVRALADEFRNDIDMLGRLVFYVLTSGQNPFGEELGRDVRSCDNQMCLDPLDDDACVVAGQRHEEAREFVRLLLDMPDLEKETTMDEIEQLWRSIMQHPFMLRDDQQMRLFHFTMDYIAACPMAAQEEYHNALKALAVQYEVEGWMDKVGQPMAEYAKLYRNSGKPFELAKLIRNCYAHPVGFSNRVDVLGVSVDQAMQFFRSSVPCVSLWFYQFYLNTPVLHHVRTIEDVFERETYSRICRAEEEESGTGTVSKLVSEQVVTQLNLLCQQLKYKITYAVTVLTPQTDGIECVLTVSPPDERDPIVYTCRGKNKQTAKQEAAALALARLQQRARRNAVEAMILNGENRGGGGPKKRTIRKTPLPKPLVQPVETAASLQAGPAEAEATDTAAAGAAPDVASPPVAAVQICAKCSIAPARFCCGDCANSENKQ
eukprot:TRINITY_DN2972_c0_g3_i2.p1 TRINITY_DN2972_c0_g3~~TRINITY_DN2972_c0_g3_i2.p1  ORF type:complete len:554 (-),score=122.40 TRINITY_DN2972_c0_g3_i2:266-1927(-)